MVNEPKVMKFQSSITVEHQAKLKHGPLNQTSTRMDGLFNTRGEL